MTFKLDIITLCNIFKVLLVNKILILSIVTVVNLLAISLSFLCVWARF